MSAGVMHTVGRERGGLQQGTKCLHDQVLAKVYVGNLLGKSIFPGFSPIRRT